jgi:GMP synthase-like glutamine amidotransferase
MPASQATNNDGLCHVLAFRHVPFEGAGLLETALARRGIELQYIDLYRGGAPPDAADADGLVFLGGPMSVNDDLPYLRVEEGIIRAAMERGQPVLGICLGSQLIARATGARVYKNRVKEIGWFDIHLTDRAAKDGLFDAMNRTENVFHWHGETFDLPDGAELLALSERCVNQAFRLGDRTYGLQFHLEVTPEMIADWMRQDANCCDVSELTEPVDPHRNAESLARVADQFFGCWAHSLGSSR